MSVSALDTGPIAFELPSALEAREPPEVRGLRRDHVRLMVARRSEASVAHRLFCELPDVLDAGDLLVVNVSGTLPAALPATRPDGRAVRIHVATRVPGLEDRWRVVEVRSADGARPERGRASERLSAPGDVTFELVAPYARSARLVVARIDGADGSVQEYLARHGSPIRYGYASHEWPLEAYQTVYARSPGSAEMPSAGRPFTAELIVQLLAKGVLIAPLTLHTGVSSPERHEPPFAEWFEVPELTAELVRTVRGRGGRVIAVGTTVVRALESVAQDGGKVAARSGWTNQVITPEHPPQLVDGLITGWHEPEASHLWMLEALAGPEVIDVSYRAALARGYLWHEFGDSHLLLP
ncbi:MAG: S-adenosylmethionine:tRNA ribosyltransferase-isomerase [Actinomycetota bacterium]|nr:S-adenosylmethionine:tRNA ribosyltransferase-isomerase [Actinomycetota bacterium]